MYVTDKMLIAWRVSAFGLFSPKEQNRKGYHCQLVARLLMWHVAHAVVHVVLIQLVVRTKIKGAHL